MAPVGPSTAPEPVAEEMDDIFDYTVDQDVFRDVDVNMDAPSERQAAHLKPKDGRDVLGLDEEVKVTRKRQPVARLDEERLLSQAGIPKLRRIAKERFHFKGKGHEVRHLHLLNNLALTGDLVPRSGSSPEYLSAMAR
ncbi:chromosome segregation in meiosis-related protein [Xanthoria calcicola]